MQLQSILDHANLHVRNEYGLALERSRLELYTEREWGPQVAEREKRRKMRILGTYNHSTGVAKVNKDDPRWITTVLHELYGHGLYYEHALAAHDERYRILPDKMADSEGFAMWMEYQLCSVLLQEQDSRIPKFYRESYEQYRAFEEKETALGVMAALGFPLRIRPEHLAAYVQRLVPDASLIIAQGEPSVRQGTRVLAIAKESRDFYNSWLQLRTLPQDEFTYLLSHGDERARRVMLQGKPVRGEKIFAKLRATLS